MKELELKILELLNKKHMLKIIQFMAEKNNPLRFQDLEKGLGINTKILTDRLHELDQMGLIIRKQDPNIYKKVEYSLVDIIPELTAIFDCIKTLSNKLQNLASVKI